VSVVAGLDCIVAVTGLAFEARLAGCVAVVSDGVRTPALLQKAISSGVRGILSFGVCGGLSPHLAPGQWVVASSILLGEEAHFPHQQWSQRLSAMLPRSIQGPILAVEQLVASAKHKPELYARTGAIAVDMESHFAAKVAAAHNLPFASCRVVIDPAHRRLPPAALLNLRPGGAIDLRAVVQSVIRRPGQLPDLLRLAIDAFRAQSALRRGRALLGPTLLVPEA